MPVTTIPRVTDYSPVPELNALYALDDPHDEFLAEGLELGEFNDRSGLRAGWSADPEFLDRLLPFASANGSGSEYALWRVDDRADLAALPVVAFGDEGGAQVIARDLRELLRILAYDVELTIDWDSACYYKDDEHEASTRHDDYVAWLGEHLGLTPDEDPDEAIAAAQAQYGEQFARWCKKFLSE